ncbi:cytochrome P450 [Suillus spraguei]|nr:cytochrome P450 [Suillus spraguei]
MLRLPDLRISGNTQLVLGATACIGAMGVIIRAYIRKFYLPPSPPTWRPQGHFLPLTSEAAVDIMEKQGRITADRPHFTAAEIYTHGLSIGLLDAGEKFRRMRSQIQLRRIAEPLQMLHAKTVILNILDDPWNFQNHVAAYSTTTIMKIAYGKTTSTSSTDPEVIETHELLKRFDTILHPGHYLVDFIPWLKHLPWYAQELRNESERARRLYTDQLNRTSEAICTVLMAAAHFPEEQAKVQAGLDADVGRERAPTFADRPSLPRLEAFISEALRWRPSGGKDYCIPAGTLVFGNHWAIFRDPERWIDDQGRLRDDFTLFLFGFGRRSMFIISLLTLWAFRLSLDPTKPQDDMRFMNSMMPNAPCTIEFRMRIPEAELRRMMQNNPEAE